MSLHKQAEKKKALNEMRRLMVERKNKDKKPNQINNPLAKYNNLGQLTCVLCSSIVRSEHVWQVHLNSKQHKENVEKAKKLKELTNNFTDVKIKSKRIGPAISEGPPEKQLKSILKNSNNSVSYNLQKPKNDAPNIYSFHNEEIKRKQQDNQKVLENNTTDGNPEISKVPEESESENLQSDPEKTNTQPIPEGFFDDPILDAKARNIEYKDPIEEEWEKFQKEIKEETTTSAEIIAGEQEQATAERQIHEIDEQIRNWSRVLDLEVKKEETKKKTYDADVPGDYDEESDNETDIDEFLDWRAKKSYS